MKTHYLILAILLKTAFSTYAQQADNCELPMGQTINKYSSVDCNNERTPSSSTLFLTKYSDIKSYIPNVNTTIKTIKIAIHVFTVPDRGLQESAQTIADLKQMASWTSGFYQNVAAPTTPMAGVQYLTDSKIRINVDDRIYFYNNTNLGNSNITNTMRSYVLNNFPGREEGVINLFISSGSGSAYAIAPYPIYINQSYSNSGSLTGPLEIFMNVQSNIGYAASQTLAHELGHCLDLFHTYEASCCHEECDKNSLEYLDDVFGSNPATNCWHQGGWSCIPNPQQNTCTNNLMGGTQQLNYFISPKQIAKIHRAIAIKSSRQFIMDCPIDLDKLIIANDESWDFSIRLYKSLLIKSGNTLTLNCEVLMPDNAMIIVEEGANLVLNGAAKITKACNGGDFTNICSPNLYMQDIASDDGTEPLINPSNKVLWESPAIFIRKTNDALTNAANQKDEPAEYRGSGIPNYIYIWMKNKGCAPSGSNNKLRLYFAHASTGLKWEDNWKYNTVFVPGYGNVVAGDEITKNGAITIPSIPAGGEDLLEIPWTVPNPKPLGGHYCILARIETQDISPFGMTNEQPSVWVGINVQNNNNIAWRNIGIVDEVQNDLIGNNGGDATATIIIRNANAVKGEYKFTFKDISTKLLLDAADVRVNLGAKVFKAWMDGGMQGEGVQISTINIGIDKILNLSNIIGTSPTINTPLTITTIKLTSANAWIGNIQMDAKETHNVALDFKFKKATNQNEQYALQMGQYEQKGSEDWLAGGETFIVNRNSCAQPLVSVNNSGTTALLSVSIPSSQKVIGYSWYYNDVAIPSGNLQVYTTTQSGNYKVVVTYKSGCTAASEIISLSLGVNVRKANSTNENKTLSEKEVQLILYPNPVSNELKINATLPHKDNMQIAIYDMQGKILYNATINDAHEGVNEISINTASLPVGVYIVKVHTPTNEINKRLIIVR